MIIYSPSVQNVLDRLYLSAVTMGHQPIEYNRCLESIHAVESGIIRTVAQKPLSWARAGLFVAKAGRYWFGYVIQENVVIIEEVFDCVRNTIIDESTIRKKITLTESDVRRMVKECVERILSEQQKRKIGIYDVIDGDSLEHEADSIIQFGHFNDIRMYSSDEETYCLMRRCNNGAYFFTKIVDAPELGEKETKFVPVKPKDVPPIILRDAQSLIRSSATLHNLLF